jgi:hypothetical protein
MKPYTPSTPTRLFGKIDQKPMTGPGFPAIMGKSIDELATLGSPLFSGITGNWWIGVGVGVLCIATGLYILSRKLVH